MIRNMVKFNSQILIKIFTFIPVELFLKIIDSPHYHLKLVKQILATPMLNLHHQHINTIHSSGLISNVYIAAPVL